MPKPEEFIEAAQELYRGLQLKIDNNAYVAEDGAGGAIVMAWVSVPAAYMRTRRLLQEALKDEEEPEDGQSADQRLMSNGGNRW